MKLQIERILLSKLQLCYFWCMYVIFKVGKIISKAKILTLTRKKTNKK